MQSLQSEPRTNQVESENVDLNEQHPDVAAHILIDTLTRNEACTLLRKLHGDTFDDPRAVDDPFAEAHRTVDDMTHSNIAEILPFLRSIANPNRLSYDDLEAICGASASTYETISDEAHCRMSRWVKGVLQTIPERRQAPVIAAIFQAAIGEPVAEEYRDIVAPVRKMSTVDRDAMMAIMHNTAYQLLEKSFDIAPYPDEDEARCTSGMVNQAVHV